jgi:hypothetical protein
MRSGEAVLERKTLGARGYGAAECLPRGLFRGDIATVVGGTPFRPASARGTPGKFSRIPVPWARTAGARLSAGAGTVRANESIRQKIIGHRMAVGRRRIGSGGFRRGFAGCGARAAIALLDQPAGDHGVGVFIQPLIQERRDLLAEIGGVAEAGKLVGVQGVAGSGEQELPRRLGALRGQEGLPYDISNVLRQYRSIENSRITSNGRVHGLWKSVENEENPENPDRACSGCAGDYEDPDRTAWEEDPEEEEAEEVGDETSGTE